MTENKNRAKRETSHFKINLLSEISPNTEFNMLKFITTSLKVLGSATIKFDVRMNHHRARVKLSAESVERTAESNLTKKIDS